MASTRRASIWSVPGAAAAAFVTIADAVVKSTEEVGESAPTTIHNLLVMADQYSEMGARSAIAENIKQVDDLKQNMTAAQKTKFEAKLRKLGY